MSQKHSLAEIRNCFPQLKQQVYGSSLIYLDTAATALKPLPVIEALQKFYSEEYATVHRAIYFQSQNATHRFDLTRQKVAQWLGAEKKEEIVFTKGTTDSLNLLAYLMTSYVTQADVILVSEIEHHSNLIPWQLLSKRTGVQLKIVRVLDNGDLDLQHLEELLKEGKVALLSIAHVSNITGGVHPIKAISQMIHQYGALLSVDGAQAVGHLSVDVKALGVDFYHFSAHKIYGPTGIGVFYAPYDWLDATCPVFGGGDMVKTCFLNSFIPHQPPLKFEAGTPHIAGVIGLGEAIDFLKKYSFDEQPLACSLRKKLNSLPSITIIGNPQEHTGLVSFTCKNAHSLDIALLLDAKGIALRSGHLCSQPALQRFGCSSFLRASIGIYTTEDELDYFITHLQSIRL